MAAALSAITDICCDAMAFWRDLESGAADKLAAAGQAAMISLESESGYKSAPATPASKRPEGRSTGSGKGRLIEFCCDKDSNMGIVGSKLGLVITRLYKESFDLTQPAVIDQLICFIREHPGISIWGSLPCTTWCSWQHMNVHKHGAPYLQKLQARRRASLRLFASFRRVAEVVRENGGDVTFEWPKDSLGWAQGPVSRFIADFDLSEALCDGCAFGMKDGNGHPILKPWRIVTTSRLLAQNMSKCRCTHERGFRHAQLEGSLTPASAFYPPSMSPLLRTPLM
jgi:hypothetical protein